MRPFLTLILLLSSIQFVTAGPKLKDVNSVTINQSDRVYTEPLIGMEKFYKKWKSYSSYTRAAGRNKIEGHIYLCEV